MQRREKILGGVLAAVIGSWWVLPAFDAALFGPFRNRDASLQALRLRVAAQDADRKKLVQAQGRLKVLERQSLPPNTLEAHRQYQIWLTDMAHVCGLSGLKVEPLPRRPAADSYTTIPVKLSFAATYDQLVRFLQLVDDVDLAQRVDACKITPRSSDNPLMDCVVGLEGASLKSAPARAALFTEFALREALPVEADRLPAPDLKAVPATPFRLLIDNELIEVSAVESGQWSLVRGVGGARAGAHAAGAAADVLPLRTREADRSPGTAALAAASPFQKPRPPIEYRPRLAPSGIQEFLRGAPLNIRLTVESWDPAAGPAHFEFEGTPPAGLQLDAATGALTWNPSEDVPVGEHPVKVRARSLLNPTVAVSTDLVLRLKNPNHPPVVQAPPPPTAYLGQLLKLQFTATDPDAADKLTYALSGTPPAGAAIDASSGLLSWTPADDLAAGDYTLVVTVTDTGDPPQSASATVVLKTQEDAARFTRLTGCVNLGGQFEAMFYDRSTNKSWTLHAGDEADFAEFHVKLLEIGADFVRLEVNGAAHRLPIGKPIREMQPEAPPTAATVPPSAGVSDSATDPAAATGTATPEPAPTPEPAAPTPASAPGASPAGETPAGPMPPAVNAPTSSAGMAPAAP